MAVHLKSAGLNLAPLVSCYQVVSEEDKHCLPVDRLSWNPSILPWVACDASEQMCLQRSHRSVGWQSQAPWGPSQFFISVVRVSFLGELSGLSLDKYAKFPCVNCMLGSNFKGSERFGEIFSLYLESWCVWCEL